MPNLYLQSLAVPHAGRQISSRLSHVSDVRCIKRSLACSGMHAPSRRQHSFVLLLASPFFFVLHPYILWHRPCLAHLLLCCICQLHRFPLSCADQSDSNRFMPMLGTLNRLPAAYTADQVRDRLGGLLRSAHMPEEAKTTTDAFAWLRQVRDVGDNMCWL